MPRPARSKGFSATELHKDCLKKPERLRKDDAWNEHAAKGLGFPTSLGAKHSSSLPSSFTEVLHEDGAQMLPAQRLSSFRDPQNEGKE